MKKRVLSLFMVLVLCLTLLPTAAFAEGEDVSISGGVIGGGETGGEGGGIYVEPITFLQGSYCGGTGPGRIITFAFFLADRAHAFLNCNIFCVQYTVFKNRVL